MSRNTNATLARLNSYQIAGLAIVTSTAASVAVLFAVRHFLASRSPRIAYAPGTEFMEHDAVWEDGAKGRAPVDS